MVITDNDGTLKKRPTTTEVDCPDEHEQDLVSLKEVVVRYSVEGEGRELSINPRHRGEHGRVQTMIWDNHVWNEVFWRDGGKPDDADMPPLPESADVQIMRAQSYDFGVKGRIRCRINDQWYQSEECDVSLVICRYFSPKKKTHYEVTMPVASQGVQYNLRAEGRQTDALKGEFSKLSRAGGYHELYIREGAHAVFWRRADCITYRKGLLEVEPRKPISRTLSVSPEGEYRELDGEDVPGFQLFRPSYPALPGRYNTAECKVCTHFDNCDWSCVGDS